MKEKIRNNKKTKKQVNIRDKKGITLIGLVITIIVLLILAGVSIATLTGENGILTRANDAKGQTEIASVKEQAQLDIANWMAEEVKNGIDGTISDWEDIKNILDTANPDAENRYYKNVTEEGVETPNGYIVPIEELYTTGTTGEVTEVTARNYGDRVNYISKGDSSLIWRIFYDDENYVYLISSKTDGSNTIDFCQLNTYPGSTKTYSGSVDITDNFLQSLNSQWFDIVKTNPSEYNNAKAIAYLMDQDVWDKYKDGAENASYAIGGPTLELFMNSYNKSEETSNEIEITNCNLFGYNQNTASNWLLETYNNGIYNNGSLLWVASPNTYSSDLVFYVDNYDNTLYGIPVADNTSGLRPMVIIPKSKFQYKIIPEI